MTKREWQHCAIVGCNCKRRPLPPDPLGKEWICQGHWSMAAKHRRTFYNRVKRRVRQIFQDAPLIDTRKIVVVYNYLWSRLKREITEKAVGI